MTELLAEADGAVATFTLNRPERLNAVTPRMVEELDAQLAAALDDDAIRVIRLRGAGRAFCAGYDLEWAAALMRDEADPWDPAADFRTMSRYVNSYMALWRSPKPVVAQVHGVCVGGGSDLALCADLIVCAEDARIGYPPARVWGSPTTAMWFHRLGLERAKRLLLTGDAMTGATAAEWGFASGAYPADRLDDAARALCQRIARLPANQLQFMKTLVNTAVEQQGLAVTQTLGTLLDGAARHTPEGNAFSTSAAADLKAAVRARDEPFGDYGSGERTVADPLA